MLHIKNEHKLEVGRAEKRKEREEDNKREWSKKAMVSPELELHEWLRNF